MTESTKNTLIMGGFIVAAVAIGIVLWRRYQANASVAGQAAAQQSADELQYLEASALANAYSTGGYAGPTVASPSAPPSTTSLAQELAGIEAAFGITPPTTTATPATTTATPTTTTTTPTSPTTPAASITPAPAVQAALAESAAISANDNMHSAEASIL